MKQYVDLSVTINDQTYGPPSTNVRVQFTANHRPASSPNVKFDYWVATTLNASVHTGSHVDFPSHVRRDGSSSDNFRLDSLFGEALVVNVKHVKPEQGILIEDLENSGINFSKGQIVLLNTAWSDKMWGKFPDYYTRSPYLTPEAARWLASKEPRAVGFDFFEEYSARLRDFKSDDFVVHHEFLDRGVILMEHLTKLDQLTNPVDFYAAFVKLGKSDGSLARFFAILN